MKNYKQTFVHIDDKDKNTKRGKNIIHMVCFSIKKTNVVTLKETLLVG
jgi:hypothetical protein